MGMCFTRTRKTTYAIYIAGNCNIEKSLTFVVKRYWIARDNIFSITIDLDLDLGINTMLCVDVNG